MFLCGITRVLLHFLFLRKKKMEMKAPVLREILGRHSNSLKEMIRRTEISYIHCDVESLLRMNELEVKCGDVTNNV